MNQTHATYQRLCLWIVLNQCHLSVFESVILQGIEELQVSCNSSLKTREKERYSISTLKSGKPFSLNMLLHFAPRATFSLANRATRAVLISHSLPSPPVKPPPRHTKFIVSKTELISLNFPWFANHPFSSPQTSSFERQSFVFSENNERCGAILC